MMATGKMTRCRVKVLSSIRIRMSTSVKCWLIERTATENIHEQTAKCTKGNGLKISPMVRENRHWKMGHCMKVASVTAPGMAMVYCSFRTTPFIRVLGRIISFMGKVNTTGATAPNTLVTILRTRCTEKAF